MSQKTLGQNTDFSDISKSCVLTLVSREQSVCFTEWFLEIISLFKTHVLMVFAIPKPTPTPLFQLRKVQTKTMSTLFMLLIATASMASARVLQGGDPQRLLIVAP